MLREHPCPLQDEGTDATLHELAHTRIGKVALAAQMASVLGMLPFLWIEVATVAAYGLSMWAHVFKTIDLLAYILQVRQCHAEVGSAGHAGARSKTVGVALLLQILPCESSSAGNLAAIINVVHYMQ